MRMVSMVIQLYKLDDQHVFLFNNSVLEKSIFDKKKDAKQRLESAFQIQSQVVLTCKVNIHA